jgi:site-specific DNA recombinase
LKSRRKRGILFPMSRYVALYARISDDRLGRREGVDAQEHWGRDYAGSAWPGLPIEVFSDNDISAANSDHRPGYEALREAVVGGEVAHLWAVEQSRLERTEVGWFQLAAELDTAGITELHTNRDGVIRVRDEIAGIKAVLAAGEVRKLKRRVNDRLAEIAAKGEPPGSRPYGYRHVRNAEGVRTYEIVPEQAQVIRQGAERVLAGWALGNIARDLNVRGVIASRGGRFHANTIKGMLMNPTIAGYRVHQSRITGRGNWEAILDEPTWQATRAKLSQPRRVRRRDGDDQEVTAANLASHAGRRYVLTGGLAVCGVCQKPLKGMLKRLRNGTRKPYLLCHPGAGGRGCVGVMLPETEAYVVDELFRELDKPDFLDAIGSDDHADRRDQITGELSALEAKRGDLADLWGSGDLTGAEWQTARRSLAEHEQRLRADLAAIPPSLIVVDIATARGSWDSMTLDEQREFVRLFVETVTIKRATPGRRGFDPGRVVIEWRTL